MNCVLHNRINIHLRERLKLGLQKGVDGETDWLPFSAIFWRENVAEWRDSENTFANAILQYFHSIIQQKNQPISSLSTLFIALIEHCNPN